MTEKMTIQMVAQQAGVLKALEGIQKNLDKTAQKMDRVETMSRRAAKSGSEGFSKTKIALQAVVTTATSALASMLSIDKVLQQIRSKNEAIIQQGRRAAETTAGPAQTARLLRQNLQPGGDFKNREAGERFIFQQAGKLGLTFEQFAPVAGAALSARQGFGEKQALQFAQAASELNRTDTETAIAQARLGLVIAQKGKVKDPRKALGLANQIQAAFPGSEAAQLAKALPRGLAGTVSAGGRTEFGARLFTTLASIGGDFEGRRTSNFVSNIMGQLQRFNPQAGEATTFEGRAVNLTQADIEELDRARQTGDPEKIFNTIKRNPRLGDAFTGPTMTGEEGPKTAFRALVREQAEAEFRRSNQTILGLEGQAQIKFFEQLAADNRVGIFERNARARERAAAGREQATAGTPAALRGRARAILEDAQKDLAGTALFNASDLALFDELTSSAFTRFDFTGVGDLERLRGKPALAAGAILGGKLNLKTTSGAPVVSDTERQVILEQLEALKELNSGVQKIINNVRGGKRAGQPAAAANGR